MEAASKARDKETLSFVKEADGWKFDPGITASDVEQMKQGLEMMKTMPKGVIEGLKKGMENMKK